MMMDGMTLPNLAKTDTLSDRVAAQIRRELAGRRQSQASLARAMGVAQMWVSDRLSGKTQIDLNDLHRIATTMGLTPVDLFPRQEREVTVTQRQSRQAYVGHGYNARPDRGGPPPGPRRTALIPHQTHRVTSP